MIYGFQNSFDGISELEHFRLHFKRGANTLSQMRCLAHIQMTYSVDVIDAETGEVMGTRTVRDTIFIRREGDGFEVSNRKWLQNDYDGKGWVDSMQGEIEPMKTYKAEYNLKTGLLRPLEENSETAAIS